EGLLVVTDRSVTVGIERLKTLRLSRYRIDVDYFFNRKDLHRSLAPDVGSNRVLVLALIEQDRLAGLRKEIDDRRAAEAERARIDAQFELLLAVVELERRQQKYQLHLLLVARLPDRREIRQFNEEILLRKREVFVHQPVGEQRPPRIGQ